MESSSSRVLIIYTGGTIGMKPTESGLRPAPGFLSSRLSQLPQFHDGSTTDCLTTPISRFVQTSDWVRMIEDIESNYDKYDAFIIIHGTDTMAYTAAGLSFMIENLGKTVILTGSQIPLAMEPNDAAQNLLGAITVAGHFEIPEVCLFFDNKLMRGNRTRKTDALGFSAFSSDNFHELAKVGSELEVAWGYIRDPPLPDHRPIFHRTLSEHIGVLKLFPGISETTIKNFLLPPLKGCVLETYGSGNAPDNRKEFLSALQEASERGVVICNITQCLKGSVQDYTYATGIALAKAGVVSGFDMTTEAALAKLSYLLAREDFDVVKIRSLMGKNLRGELTPPQSSVRYSFRDELFINSVAKALAEQDGRGDSAKLGPDLRMAIFPVLLCSAAGQGYIPQLQSLVKSGADINMGDYDKRTPLHVACAEGQLKAAKWLVDKGADIHTLDRWGASPLYDAIRGNHQEVVEFLRSKGAKDLELAPDDYAALRARSAPKLNLDAITK